MLLAVSLFPAFTQAATLSNAQIQAIISLLSAFGADSATIANVNVALTGGTPTTGGQSFCHNFNSDITVGSRGETVSALNQALSSSGIDTTGNSSDFNEDNASDVVRFQAKYGIRQTGYVGPLTRAKLNALYRCNNNQQPTPQPTPPTTSAPTCALTSKPYMVMSGEKTALSWTSQNASYGVWEQNSSANVLGLSTNALSANGSITITIGGGKGTQTPTLRVYGSDGSSATCNTVVDIEVATAQGTATIDDNSGQAMDVVTSARSIFIVGTATGVSSVGLVIGGPYGDKIYSNTIPVVNGQYRKSIPSAELNLAPGNYSISIYNGNMLLAQKTMSITNSLPTCLLTMDKNHYIYGTTGEIVFSWTSQNATYAAWQQDRSADLLGLQDNKLKANGSQSITTTIANNLTVTLLIYNAVGNGSCSATISVVG